MPLSNQHAAAAFALAATLILFGKPRDELLDHLLQVTALVGGGWMLVSGAVALRVAAWFTRWERLRGKVLVCAPRHSGRLYHVYYAAEPAGGVGEAGVASA